jgi:hypothetical protein
MPLDATWFFSPIYNWFVRRGADRLSKRFAQGTASERIIPVRNKTLGEGTFVKNMIDRARPGDTIIFMVRTATFPDHVNDALFRASGRGVRIRLLLPVMKDSMPSVQRFSGKPGFELREFDPGNLRMLLLNDEALVGISDPETRDYGGIYIREDSFAEYLRTSAEKAFSESKPVGAS